MKTYINSIALLCVLNSIFFSLSIYAQTPQLLNYQGKLHNKDGTAASGVFPIVFAIYADSTGGTALWDETQDVTAKNGLFNVLLGSVRSFPGNLFVSSGQRYLGIKVGTDPEMKPRFRLTSVAYAFHAKSAINLSASDGDPGDAVVVDESGNVGIGTTTPQAQLDVKGGDNSFAWGGDYSDSGYVRIGNLQICWGSLYVGEGLPWKQGDNLMYLDLPQSIIIFMKPFKTPPTVTFSVRDGHVAARSAYVSFFNISTMDIKNIALSSPAWTYSSNQSVLLEWIAIGNWR